MEVSSIYSEPCSQQWKCPVFIQTPVCNNGSVQYLFKPLFATISVQYLFKLLLAAMEVSSIYVYVGLQG